MLKTTDSQRPASILAHPNPVPAGSDPGRTTITWDTGLDGVIAEIYVSVDGAKETLFARGAKGALEAPWIGSGSTYEFRMYNAADTKTPLTRTVVTRQAP